MNQLQIFSNSTFGGIRTIEENGAVLFCGSDVAKALGYTNTSKAINDHCRAITKRSTPISGKMQEINYIPEGDLYRLITHSKLPSAEQFERWVFDDVLPAIRKHGMYAKEELLDNPDLLIEVATALKEERKKNQSLQQENSMQKQIIGEMQPMADYVSRILDNHGLVTITQIAKDYGMSGRTMNHLLHKLGVQYKTGGQWLLYAKYHNKGYTHSKTIDICRSDGSSDVVMETKWTQKGRLFLYELLKDNGEIPVIERDGR